MKKAVAAIFVSALVLAMPTAAFAHPTDVVIGGGECDEKDVVIIIPNPANDDEVRVCFNYPT